ncbi:hypothetical protein BBOMB_1439 [Bifidobacterium bombi DSM 19703]|uniref:Uncharacterized protein n=1 Tax=Bifidobacterium bombi DSM 19703 TaxID=1341695 RepID=A0A086BNR4_9BIFI|nr:hypothetical protein BBOMB_1439 [Bifidobacterium bombi DSM 19703]
MMDSRILFSCASVRSGTGVESSFTSGCSEALPQPVKETIVNRTPRTDIATSTRRRSDRDMASAFNLHIIPLSISFPILASAYGVHCLDDRVDVLLIDGRLTRCTLSTFDIFVFLRIVHTRGHIVAIHYIRPIRLFCLFDRLSGITLQSSVASVVRNLSAARGRVRIKDATFSIHLPLGVRLNGSTAIGILFGSIVSFVVLPCHPLLSVGLVGSCPNAATQGIVFPTL